MAFNWKDRLLGISYFNELADGWIFNDNIYISGIQNISTEVVEAAKIDGASSWQRLKYIIFPLVRPAMTISVFLTLSNSFKLYDQNLSLTAGGPGNSTQMIAMNILIQWDKRRRKLLFY